MNVAQATASLVMNQTRKRLLLAIALTSLVAVVGLYLVVLMFFGIRGANQCFAAFGPHALVGFLAIAIGVLCLPPRLLYRIRESSGLGGVFGFIFFVFGTIFGTLSTAVRFSPWDLKSYFIQPVEVMSLWGAIPAFVVGIIGSAILKAMLPALPQGESLN